MINYLNFLSDITIKTAIPISRCQTDNTIKTTDFDNTQQQLNKQHNSFQINTQYHTILHHLIPTNAHMK